MEARVVEGVERIIKTIRREKNEQSEIINCAIPLSKDRKDIELKGWLTN